MWLNFLFTLPTGENCHTLIFAFHQAVKKWYIIFYCINSGAKECLWNFSIHIYHVLCCCFSLIIRVLASAVWSHHTQLGLCLQHLLNLFIYLDGRERKRDRGRDLAFTGKTLNAYIGTSWTKLTPEKRGLKLHLHLVSQCLPSINGYYQGARFRIRARTGIQVLWYELVLSQMLA